MNQIRTKTQVHVQQLIGNINGKMPPQAVDLEEAVLGALMIEKNAIDRVVETLKPDHFYKDAHQYIYKAALELFEKSQPVDILTVTNYLRSAGVLNICGGPLYITSLTDRVASAGNIEHHAKIITQKWLARELIIVGGNIANEAYEETTDIYELLNKAETLIGNITEQSSQDLDEVNFSKGLQEIRDTHYALQQTGQKITGVPTGTKQLDEKTAGWQPGHLIILAARPGMGKTARALAFAKAAAQKGIGVALHSLEMPGRELLKRFIIETSMVYGKRFKEGTLTKQDFHEIDEAIRDLQKLPIYICETPGINTNQVKAFTRKMNRKKKVPVGLVIIDYLQLMRGEGKDNREQEVSSITRSLKGFAKEAKVPIIALSQVSREVDKRSNKRPLLVDLRESGSIEQDADMVAFMYRHSYYFNYGRRDEEPQYESTRMTEQQFNQAVEFRIEKYRDGDPEVIMERFDGPIMKFLDSNIISGGLFSADTDDLPF